MPPADLEKDQQQEAPPFSRVMAVFLRRMFKAMILFAFILLLSLWIWIAFFPPNLAGHIPQVADLFLRQSGLELHMKRLHLRLGLTLTLEGEEVRVGLPGADRSLMKAGSVRLRFSPLQWFQGWASLSVLVRDVHVTLTQNAKGEIFLDDQNLETLKNQWPKGEGGKKSLLPIQQVSFQNASVTWVDETLPTLGKPETIGIHRSQLVVFLESDGMIGFRLEGVIPSPGWEDRISLIGKIHPKGVWWVEAKMEDLHMKTFKPYLAQIPPLNDFSAPVTAKIAFRWFPGQHGLFSRWRIQTGGGSIHWPTLFRWPIALNGLTAMGSLTMDHHLWNLTVQRFDLVNPDGQAGGSLHLTGLGGGDPVMDLMATVQNVPGNKAKIYYPAAIMHPALIQWLDESLVGGTVTQAKTHIKGPIKDIPFPLAPKHKKKPSEPKTFFSIVGDVEGISLIYYPQLPPLQNMKTHVTFDRLGMMAQIPLASFGKNRHVSGTVRIADMVHNPVVEMNIKALDVEMESIWKDVVAHPTLRWDEEVGLQGMKLNGKGNVELNIALLLDDIKASRFQSRLDFHSALIHPPFLSTPLTEASGHLELDTQKIRVDITSAAIKEIHLVASLEATSYQTPEKSRLKGRIVTELDEKRLRKWFIPLLGEQGEFSGAAPLEVELQRNAGDPRFHLKATVPAKEFAIHGPLGWNKAAQTSGAILLEGEISLDGQLEMASLQADLGNLSLLGSGSWHLGEERGWLEIRSLRLGNNSGSLRITQTNPLPSGTGEWTITANMDKLDISAMLEPSPSVTVPKKTKITTTSWPNILLNLQSKNFTLANQETGRQLEAKVHIENRMVELKNLSGRIHNKDHHMDGEIVWPFQFGSGYYTGRLHLQSEDVGTLFVALDLYDGILKGGTAELDLTLDGFLPPGTSLKDHLTGEGEFRVFDGSITRLRFMSQVLGLFSLKELPNLVVGDRPDLTTNGFRFDTMKGKMRLDESVATLNEWTLDGPSMNIVLSGTLDFPGDSLNLLMGLRPLQTLDKVVNSVPLLGKLVAGSRETILETQFDIVGLLSDPKVKLRPIASLAPGIVRDILSTHETPEKPPRVNNADHTEQGQ